MQWIQMESGPRNVRERAGDGCTWRVVVGYDITEDNYRVHIYKVGADGVAEKMNVNITADSLEDGFASGAHMINDMF